MRSLCPILPNTRPSGGGDALDGADGAVGIESSIHCSISVKACILRGDLAVCGKLFDQLLRGEKTPLAVRNGNGVNISHLCSRKPRRSRRAHARAHELGLVAADDIVGECREGLVGIHDPSVGHEAELDERLEAVADAEHQTVALLEQRRHLLADGGVAEKTR